MISARSAALAGLLGLLSCSDDAAPPADGSIGADAGVTVDGYCERLVGPFCNFYLRCGRMAASTAAECREVFLETCNLRYEPQYQALVEAGLLSLSAPAIATCEQHLASVPCARQIRDLDGPCGELWRGHQPVGGPCGLDIESFVCAPGAACKLGLDLCGSCAEAAGPGEACGDGVVCGGAASCVDDRCVERADDGEPCADAPCVVGAKCVDGVCVAPAFVGEGQACDSSRRCVYLTSCVSGVCRRKARLGETCDETTRCDGGRCLDGTCVEPLLEGSCAEGSDCLSGSCRQGQCDAIPGACF